MADQSELVLTSVTTSTTDRTDDLLPGAEVHNSQYNTDHAWEILDVTIKGDEDQPDKVVTDIHFWTKGSETAEDHYAGGEDIISDLNTDVVQGRRWRDAQYLRDN
ncbi:hypothetical protein B9479_003664 [Cryptococcus floricola]|uniref:Uncharacterized protein n=1 Tax=Cryptococcus floricola TaxID=2591691 RepID=A0A5D3AXQ6_9TREE|nr:hypothetical protein B9479_003664 [Cryptococcus floricola]